MFWLRWQAFRKPHTRSIWCSCIPSPLITTGHPGGMMGRQAGEGGSIKVKIRQRNPAGRGPPRAVRARVLTCSQIKLGVTAPGTNSRLELPQTVAARRQSPRQKPAGPHPAHLPRSPTHCCAPRWKPRRRHTPSLPTETARGAIGLAAAWDGFAAKIEHSEFPIRASN